MLDRDALADLLPHGGAMLLLDAVVSWTSERIACTASSHRSPDHPLRTPRGLAAICAVEYGAQAMAAHGALLAGGVPQRGYLASLRKVRLAVPRLDLFPGDLAIEARLLLRSSNGFVYGFRVKAGRRELASGQAAVVTP